MSAFPPKPYVRIKVVSLGSSGVGKSCLIKRYCEKKFVSKYISTIGVDFGVRVVAHAGEETKVNLFDLAGGEEFKQVRAEFHRDAQGVMLVFDVSNRTSFDSLDTWMAEHTTQGGKPSIVVVCANKADEEYGRRTISEAEGKKYAMAKGYEYMETSAKSGQNVEQLFETLFDGIKKKKG